MVLNKALQAAGKASHAKDDLVTITQKLFLRVKQVPYTKPGPNLHFWKEHHVLAFSIFTTHCLQNSVMQDIQVCWGHHVTKVAQA